MTGYPFALGLTALVVVFVLLLLRTRRLREKYAAIWLVLAVVVVVLAVFPDVAAWVAGLVGVETPVNLLFSSAIVVLLAVCIQLSSEVSALEEETRTVAEELALLGERVDRLQAPASPASGPAVPSPHVPDPHVPGPPAQEPGGPAEEAVDGGAA